MTNPTTTQTKAFDIHTRCAGYANRIRMITPNKGNPYYAVTVAALRGKPDNNGKYDVTYFDCTVVGKLAIERIKELKSIQDKNEEAKIFITCNLGDLFAGSPFEVKGKMLSSIKGRVLKIDMAKVNGNDYEFIAQPEPKDDQNPSDDKTANQPVEESLQQGQQEESSNEPDPMPEVVQLDTQHPDYASHVAELARNGYQIDPADGFWKLPKAA